MVDRLISLDRSIIPTTDVETIEDLKKLAVSIRDVPGIEAVKIGFSMLYSMSLGEQVKLFEDVAGIQKTIYDHQKAATDVPDTAGQFARMCRKAGFSASIVFPHSGPATQKAYIEALQGEGVRVLAGAHMTHDQFTSKDQGYIKEEALFRSFALSTELGVRDFVLPGNQPDLVATYRQHFANLGLKDGDYAVYAPGFVAQKGVISETGKVAGPLWHAIVGRGIYKAEDKRAAAIEMTSQLI